MSRLSRISLFFFTAVVGSSMLLSPLAVYAADHDFRIAPSLYNKRPDADPVDITHNYYSAFLDSLNPSSSSNPDRNKAALERDYTRAIDTGTILLIQYANESSSYGFVQLFFNYSRDCSVVLSKQSNTYFLSVDGSKNDCLFRKAFFDANPIANYYGNSSSNLSLSVPVSGTYVSFYSYNGNYTVDSSAEGVSLPSVDADSDSTLDWNDNCGLDVVCHLGNIGIAIKSFFSFFVGMFDFSENNSLLKLLKWLFIPEDIKEVLDFTGVMDNFNATFSSVFSVIDSLKSVFSALTPHVGGWNYSNYCTTSHVGDLGVQDSGAHRYIMQTKIFGADFKPDICSFERAIGGFNAMASIRVFTSSALLIVSFILWYGFLLKLTGKRF